MINKSSSQILIVEDEPSICFLLKDFLSLYELHSIIVQNPSNIDKIIEQNQFSLALLDYGLPNLNGLDIAEIIRKKEKDCYIVLMTGWFPQIDDIRTQLVDNILHKPFQLEELRRILDEQGFT